MKMKKKISCLLVGLIFTGPTISYSQNQAKWDEWYKRVEFGVDASKGLKPTWYIETVQPIYQSQKYQDTFFTQLRAANNERFGEYRVTYNGGLGYRRLLGDNAALIGINSFYDIETKYSIKRWSVGGELRWNAFDLYYNQYMGISDWTTTNNNAQEKPLNGYDLDFGLQIPFLPWAKAHWVNYRYKKILAAEDVSGNKYSIEGNLSRHLSIEYGYNKHQDAMGLNGQYVMLRFNLLGNNTKKATLMSQPYSNKPFEARDMSDHVLDRVRRNNVIMVERKSSGVVISRGD